MTEPAASRFEIDDEPRFPLRHPPSPVHNARRLALDGPSMRDPKMSRSETAGPVAEMTDATATKSEDCQKMTTVTAARRAASDTRWEPRAALGLHLTLDRNREY